MSTYTYNASNQRTKKVAGANTTHYVYGAGGLLYGEYDNAGALIREYVYLNDEPLAQINAGTPETLTYLHPDHLGTPKYATNTGGSQVWAWAPDAFGNGTPSGSATVNLRMPGQYYDAESGIFYNWNRYYNPEIGRYISSDPIGLEGGMNTFLYVAANPLLYSDREGLVAPLIAAVPVVVEGGLSAAATAAAACSRNPRCAGLVIKVAAKAAKELSKKTPKSATVPQVGPSCPYTGYLLKNESEESAEKESPNIQDLGKIGSNDEANKVAQEYGYKDAHEAKKDRGDSSVNIYKDKKTGEYYVWDGKAGSEPDPL